MITIPVAASKSYEVCIAGGLLSQAGTQLANSSGAAAAAVISDDTVFPLYGQKLLQSLAQAGFRTVCFTFPHGENSKNISTYSDILNFLAQNHITRTDLLVALGGGVVGDLGGFAAATYLRGIDYVQLPTTLLAMVDSSVGGKTAIDLPAGKNLAGAFYPPALVLCDPETLRTLPAPIFRDGCAEVIKYAILGNAPFFAQLAAVPAAEQPETVIETCVRMKRDIVCKDEFDRGLRRVLNLGHSFGHAVELCSGYAVSHGSAVAIGMSMMARAAAKKGFCSEETAQKILALLQQYSLPTQCDFSADMLLGALCSDKKVTGNSISLIVPQQIGSVCVQDVALCDLPDWLRLGGAL